MPGVQARKKPRKKAEPMDEDTMVALALSTSLLNQERESERWLQTETAASDVAGTPVLKWRPEAGTVTSLHHKHKRRFKGLVNVAHSELML